MRISLRSSSLAGVKHASARKGFAIVEVIVAMVLLGVAVSSLAALVYSVSQSGIKTTGDAYRNGVLMQEVNQLESLPYDSIPAGTASVSVTGGSYPHTRVVTITETAANLVKTVRVVITPSNPIFKPDTVQFTRTKARTSKVLCTDCPQG
ncbi:MAG: type IV pilus modification PilV family protein [Gemmatimonadaceae bacterium]